MGKIQGFCGNVLAAEVFLDNSEEKALRIAPDPESMVVRFPWGLEPPRHSSRRLSIRRGNGATLLFRGSTMARSTYSGCDIDAALDYISKHACEGIKVADVIARTQAVSRVTFHRNFNMRVGATPSEVIQKHKLEEARRLLAETEITATSIANMCGFCDYAHFYRVFRKRHGVSPSVFRSLAS